MGETAHHSLRSVVLIKDTPFSAWDYQRLGIELLKKNGLSVEIWDVTQVVHPRVPYTDHPLPAPMIPPRVFSDKNELFRSLDRLDPSGSAIVLLFTLTNRSYGLYRAISKRSLYYIVLFLNVVPTSACRSIREKSLVSFKDFLKKFFLYPKLRFVESALDNFILRWYRVLGVKAANLCLLGGKECEKGIPFPIDGKTRLFWGHAFDYDIFLNKKDNTEKPDRPFAVFIDQYLPFQDVSYNNDTQVCDPDRYYPSLCRFFTRLEEQLKCRVVIAAHPRVPDIARYSVFFEGREVLPGDTAGLIQQSDLVIVHASTATNFAVLFNKPVLFITTNELNNSNVKPYIDSVADELGKELLNVAEPVVLDPSAVYSVDPAKYQSFKEKFIKTTESRDDYLWQLVADYLKDVKRS